jgi:hypothetical protein
MEFWSCANELPRAEGIRRGAAHADECILEITHPTDDVLMIREMRFATLTHVDTGRAEIDVVGEPHYCSIR